MIIHAAGESSPGGLKDTTYAVALVARDEVELLLYEKRLRLAGVEHVVVREPDAPYRNAVMAIGVVPAKKGGLRRHLSSLPLLR